MEGCSVSVKGAPYKQLRPFTKRGGEIDLGMTALYSGIHEIKKVDSPPPENIDYLGYTTSCLLVFCHLTIGRTYAKEALIRFK